MTNIGNVWDFVTDGVGTFDVVKTLVDTAASGTSAISDAKFVKEYTVKFKKLDPITAVLDDVAGVKYGNAAGTALSRILKVSWFFPQGNFFVECENAVLSTQLHLAHIVKPPKYTETHLRV